MKRQKGFTLVEIAIVMVIIGLLLGGTLKGRQIITNAKIKNLENDYQGLQAACALYRDRYSSLPGDDSRAKIHFGEEVNQGNGDGYINGVFNSETETDESRLVWSHLRAAGLVTGAKTATELPLHAFSGLMGISSQLTMTRSMMTLVGTYVGFADISNEIALILDSKLDDGYSDQGKIQSDSLTQYIGSGSSLNLYFSL